MPYDLSHLDIIEKKMINSKFVLRFLLFLFSVQRMKLHIHYWISVYNYSYYLQHYAKQKYKSTNTQQGKYRINLKFIPNERCEMKMKTKREEQNNF